jgi:citrate lyase subunit beta/citryl-CoA lyase
MNHDYVLADLEAIIWPGLSKVNYPKAEYGSEIRQLDEIITRLERERGIRPGTVEIGANIETAVGVANGYEIASASPRVQDFGGASGYTCRVTWA